MQLVFFGVISVLPSLCDAAALRTKTNLDSGVTTAILGSLRTESSKIADKTRLIMPEKGTLDSIESSLLGMAKGRLAQTQTGDAHQPPSADLVGFLGEISAMIDNTMKPTIQNRHKTLQDDMDLKWSNVTNHPCQSPHDDEFTSELQALSATHETCRTSEGSLETTWQQCMSGNTIIESSGNAGCEEYHALLVYPTIQDTCKMKNPTPVPTIGHYLVDMENYFAGMEAKIAKAKAKCSTSNNKTLPEDCGYKMCAYQEQKLKCNNDQKVFEERSCEIHKAYTCTKFNSCVDANWAAYAESVEGSKVQEPGMISEWRALLRVECLIEALKLDGSEVGAALDACKEQVFSAADVTLKYHGAAPTKPACEEPHDLSPGTALFGSRWYQGLPYAAPAVSCASSCCSDPAYVPAMDVGVVCPYVPGADKGTAAVVKTDTELTSQFR